MSEIKIFENVQFGRVRTITKEGEPWFVASDVCKALEIKNSRDALTRLDEDEKGVALTDTLGGQQNMTIINEPGLYSLILGSRKPEAKAFKRWITHEVIPSIRRSGGYIAGQEQMTDAELVARALLVVQRQLEERNAELERVRPKALFADAVSASSDSILIGDLAKILQQNGVDIGGNRLFTWMRNNGYLMRRRSDGQNMPTQRSMEMGLFEVKETTVTHSNGRVTVRMTTKVTGKGQVYFVNKFLKGESKGGGLNDHPYISAQLC